MASPTSHPQLRRAREKSPTQRAWSNWLDNLDTSAHAVLSSQLALAADKLQGIRFNIPYFKYDNLLVLPSTALKKAPLSTVLKIAELEPWIPKLWHAFATEFHVGLVGCTAPIPLDLEERAHNDTAPQTQETSANGTNVLRSPTSFQPLWGHFGETSLSLSPDAAEEVFWASATQHGVTQIWSPLHTMFSNGNISEKARVMSFGRNADEKTTAVDLYAGIGYFALFYRKQVADVVLGWEINPWSVEGFRRGAHANRWGDETLVVQASYPQDNGRVSGPQRDWVDIKGDKKLLIMFEESNENALNRVAAMKGLPPIRHVNCGYLPSSSPSWRTAVGLVLFEASRFPENVHGCIHAHENIAIEDIEKRTVEVVAQFQTLADHHLRSLHTRESLISYVFCEKVAQVKTYAPGIMHCVLDISVLCGLRTPR